MPSFIPPSINLIEDMQQISVDRLRSIHPVWRQFILTLNDLPVPKSFLALSEESRKCLQEWLITTQGREVHLDGNDLLLEQKLYVRSYVLLQEGGYEEARQHIAYLLECDPESSCYQLFQGLAEFGLGNYHRAIQHVDLAIYHEPDNVLAHGLSGLIAAFTRDHVKALVSTQRALAAEDNIASWGGARWLSLALFQSEHLLFGTSCAGGLDSGLFRHISPSAHLQRLSSFLSPVHEFLDFLDDGKKEVLFVSCDINYFYKYAVPLALSLAECQSPLALHLHLINPDDYAFDLLQTLFSILQGNLRATYERTDVEAICSKTIYYLCVRYCRLAEFRLKSIHDYAMFDADMLINRRFSFDDMRQMASLKADCIMVYAADEPLWDCLLGGFCLFGPYSDSLLADISDFILESMLQQKSRWFLDEVALFLAAQYAPDGTIGYIAPESFCDLEHHDTSFVWAVTTEKEAEKFVAKTSALLRKYFPNGVDGGVLKSC